MLSCSTLTSGRISETKKYSTRDAEIHKLAVPSPRVVSLKRTVVLLEVTYGCYLQYPHLGSYL